MKNTDDFSSKLIIYNFWITKAEAAPPYIKYRQPMSAYIEKCCLPHCRYLHIRTDQTEGRE
jgi:hypothetical protein